MVEALILTFMCMCVPSSCSLQAKVWFLRLIQSYQHWRMGSQRFCLKDKMPGIMQKGSGHMQGNSKKTQVCQKKKMACQKTNTGDLN